MRKVYNYRDPKTKKMVRKTYDTDKAQKLCDTPQGALYKKKTSPEFFTWKTGEPDPVSVSWADANNLVKTYGTREMHLRMFTAYGASTNPDAEGSWHVKLDQYHKIKAQRNAARLNLSIREYVCRLIDRDDDNHNFCK